MSRKRIEIVVQHAANTFFLCLNLSLVLLISNQHIKAYSWAHQNGTESTADAYLLQAYFMNSVASDARAD